MEVAVSWDLPGLHGKTLSQRNKDKKELRGDGSVGRLLLCKNECLTSDPQDPYKMWVWQHVSVTSVSGLGIGGALKSPLLYFLIKGMETETCMPPLYSDRLLFCQVIYG